MADEVELALQQLVFQNSDGTRVSRIQMEDQLRSLLKTAMLKRGAAFKYGLDKKYVYSLKPLPLLHWILDTMIARGEIVGTSLQVRPDDDYDPKTEAEFIQRLTMLVQTGEAQPQDGVTMPQNPQFPPPPQFAAPQTPQFPAPQPPQTPQFPAPPAMGQPQGGFPPPQQPPQFAAPPQGFPPPQMQQAPQPQQMQAPQGSFPAPQPPQGFSPQGPPPAAPAPAPSAGRRRKAAAEVPAGAPPVAPQMQQAPQMQMPQMGAPQMPQQPQMPAPQFAPQMQQPQAAPQGGNDSALLSKIQSDLETANNRITGLTKMAEDNKKAMDKMSWVIVLLGRRLLNVTGKNTLDMNDFLTDCGIAVPS